MFKEKNIQLSCKWGILLAVFFGLFSIQTVFAEELECPDYVFQIKIKKPQLYDELLKLREEVLKLQDHERQHSFPIQRLLLELEKYSLNEKIDLLAVHIDMKKILSRYSRLSMTLETQLVELQRELQSFESAAERWKKSAKNTEDYLGYNFARYFNLNVIEKQDWLQKKYPDLTQRKAMEERIEAFLQDRRFILDIWAQLSKQLSDFAGIYDSFINVVKDLAREYLEEHSVYGSYFIRMATECRAKDFKHFLPKNVEQEVYFLIPKAQFSFVEMQKKLIVFQNFLNDSSFELSQNIRLLNMEIKAGSTSEVDDLMRDPKMRDWLGLQNPP